MEGDCAIDKSRISIYGSCGAGFFGGRLIATYPGRFAAIVYNRAIFERDVEKFRHFPEPMASWYEAINPAGRVIDNNQIKIFVINDGSAVPGHGAVELSERFLQSASEKRGDVKARLGPQPPGVAFWDMVFDWLAPVRNEDNNQGMSGFLKEEGYEGPVAEIFSTPFLVVRGTTVGSPDAHVDSVIEHIKESYKQQFYGAEPVVRDDTDVTEDEARDYSLILVGNPASNALWKKFEADIPIKTRPSGLMIKGHEFFTNSAFLAIFEHPLNKERRILTIGSYDLKHLDAIQKADPCRAWYDCRVF